LLFFHVVFILNSVPYTLMLPNVATRTFGGAHDNGQKAKASVAPVTAVALSRLD
jgi:hypothetical protein